MQAMSFTARAAAQEQWTDHVAGVDYADAAEGSPEFFEQMTRTRYEVQPWHPALLRRWAPTGRLLEIGCGAGTDHSILASMADETMAIDLAAHGVALTQRRLILEGRSGQAMVADGEHMPFPDGSFDAVYSFGVIHHTDHPERVVEEIARVLRPGGRFLVGLYHRDSLLGWDNRQHWFRHYRGTETWDDYMARIEHGGAEREERPVVRLYSRPAAKRLFQHPAFTDVHTRLEHPRFRGRMIFGAKRLFGWYVFVSGTRR